MPNRTDILQEEFEVDWTKTDEELDEQFAKWLTAQKLMRGIPEQMHGVDYPYKDN